MHDFPALWPPLLFPCLLPVIAVLSRSRGVRDFVFRYRSRVFMWGGIACLVLFATVGIIYLFSTAFWDFYESREAALATLLLRGGVVYPDMAAPERYAAPYGPVLYLCLAVSQFLFNPSVFATKLPGVCAAFLAVGIFWEIVRRQCGSARAAWSLAGLEAVLLLALRQQVFWAKADPLLLLLVTVGLGAALGRARHWVWWFGLCLGLAANLKLHAPLYFLPSLVVAHRSGWRWREFLRAGAVGVGVGLLPFVLAPQQFPLSGYLGFLQATAHEGIGFDQMFGFWRWVFLLAGLIFLSDRLVRHTRLATPGERSLRWSFRAALGVAVLLAAVPGCAVGAGQAHLIPLIPACLLTAGDRLTRGIGASWKHSPNIFWRTAVYSSLLACGLVAVQTVVRMAGFHTKTEAHARVCRDDLRQILARFPRHTVLTATGGDGDAFAAGFRHEAVFAGQPIGLDVAAMTDYQQAGLPEPDLPHFEAEMRAGLGHPLLWLLPRDGVPYGLVVIIKRLQAQ